VRDRYSESLAEFALASLFCRPYGLAGLELDHDALLNGTVSIIHARGVMPDGLTFSFPDDPNPSPLEIRDLFSPTRESHLVLLTIPAFRPNRANCLLDRGAEQPTHRYVAEDVTLPDQTTGEDERSITLGRKNFRLALDAEEPGDLVLLPLSRVKRDRGGRFVYDGEYIPPSIQVGASRRMLEILRQLIEMMDAKSATLVGERTEPGSGSLYAPEEIAGYWLSHAIHSSLAPLRHHLRAKTSHPEEVFMELLRLAGALCTFSMDSRPRDLPLYDHDDLESCMGLLDRHIRNHLEIVLPKRAVHVPLKPLQEFYLHGTVTDQRCFRDAHWFLEVTASEGRERAIAEVPRLVKICSPRHIERLVQAAYPGMELHHVASPPAAISPRLGAEYFRIETAGPCWETTQQTQEVAVYTPGALAGHEFEILIVSEE